MPIKPNIVQEICAIARLQVQDLYPELKTIFIPHQNGAFPDIVASKDYDMPKHPATKIARTILEKHSSRDETSFIGIAISQEKKWLGLSNSDNLLAIFNVNLDQFSGPRDFRHNLYNHLWHAIDLIEVRKKPEYAGKFTSGPMIPKRSPMNLARLNLQADAFSATMCGLMGEDDAITVLAKQRAMDSIYPSSYRQTEDFPFPITLEAVEYGYQDLIKRKPEKSKYMFYARQLAAETGRAFDDSNIRQWWAFAEPAQEMAWRGFSPNIILGCAIHTSEDAFVRAMGHLVSDITHKHPEQALDEDNDFNAFANKEKTHMLHRERMEQAFEEAIAKGVYEESCQPLIMAANKQNEDMAEGHVLGWCANALQSAARAFDGAVKTGNSPAQAARLQFEGSKDSTTWEDIEKIGQVALEQRRKGNAFTLGNIAEICTQNKTFSPILGSIKMTMTDPTYIQKLAQSNDLAVKGPSLSNAPAFTPPTPTPAAPAVSVGMSPPTLGGGGAASRIAAINKARQEQQRVQSSQEEEKA